jgi:uncharacterized membrane protein YphA (DoxX/SURF4 family)
MRRAASFSVCCGLSCAGAGNHSTAHFPTVVNTLYHAHSGLRYLVLLVAVAAVAALAYGVFTGRAVRAGSALAATFAGLLDLQILLGIGLVIGGVFPDAVVGHLIMMVFAAVVTHASSIVGQRSSSERRELWIRLGGLVIALALIVGGIMAIGRGVLGSAPMTIG